MKSSDFSIIQVSIIVHKQEYHLSYLSPKTDKFTPFFSKIYKKNTSLNCSRCRHPSISMFRILFTLLLLKLFFLLNIQYKGGPGKDGEPSLASFLTLKKFGSLNHNKSNGLFIISLIASSQEWANLLKR